MNPTELEINDTTDSTISDSYLDLLLSIGKDGQLRTFLYDKRDAFNFKITNFPFLSSNIRSSPAYGVFMSQLIRYERVCSSYQCFILKKAWLLSKLLGQGYARERLKSSLRKFYERYGDLIKHYEISLSQMLQDILGHDHIQWHPEMIRHYTNLWTYYWTRPYYQVWPYCQIFGGFHRTLQRMWLANRGRLLFRTSPFWACICPNLWCLRLALAHRTSLAFSRVCSIKINFLGTTAADMACLQGILTPPTTWSCF